MKHFCEAYLDNEKVSALLTQLLNLAAHREMVR